MNQSTLVESQVNQIENYKLNQKAFVMLFQTEECGVCHVIQPRLKDMLENYGFELVIVDALKHPLIAGQHQVFTVPTIIIWSEDREILRESRFVNFSKIERILEFMQIYDSNNNTLS